MYKIGITGGVGAGKSTVLSYLEKYDHCEILKADELASELKMPGQVCYDRLADLLGEDVLSPDGTIDNRKMAGKVFSDEQLLKEVNAIIHPEVKKEIIARMDALEKEGRVRFFFLEAALLIEEHYREEVLDELWYVYASEKTRRKRLRKSRNYSDEKITGIFQSQMSEAEFRAHADYVIDNDGPALRTALRLRKKMKEYS